MKRSKLLIICLCLSGCKYDEAACFVFRKGNKVRKPEVKKEAETSVCWESSRRPTVFLQLHVKISSNILKEEFFRTSIHRSKFENSRKRPNKKRRRLHRSSVRLPGLMRSSDMVLANAAAVVQIRKNIETRSSSVFCLVVQNSEKSLKT